MILNAARSLCRRDAVVATPANPDREQMSDAMCSDMRLWADVRSDHITR